LEFDMIELFENREEALCYQATWIEVERDRAKRWSRPQREAVLEELEGGWWAVKAAD
jgi:hypothetical protein